MSKRDLNILKERVKARLRDLDMTPAEAARRGGLAKDFIYDLLNDRKRTVRADSIAKIALALDCDWQFLEGYQEQISLVDNIVDFDRPPIDIVGEVAVGIYMDKNHTYSRHRNAPDMPNLPPDTRFPAEGQIDLYIRGNSINRFAPSGFILRCVLLEYWNELIRDGDLIIVDRFKGDLRERAAWRVRPTINYIEYSTDTDDRQEQYSWRVPVKPEHRDAPEGDTYAEITQVADSDHQPVAIAIFAYAEPRIRRMF